jgi:MFS-type transporter involved in bile tolerance (Atg22 family)
MIILIMSAIGGLAFWHIADRIGTLKSLKNILVSWIVLLPLLGLAQWLISLIVLSALLWFFMGGIRTVTRAYLSQILKKEEFWYWFAFYTLFERFATFIGPLSWWWIIAIFWIGWGSYRIAMISMTAYVIIGYIILSYWRKKQHVE